MALRSCFAAVLSLVALCASPASAASTPHPSIPAGKARVFAVQIVTLMGEGRYDLAWKWLVPVHQHAAPAGRYVACERMSPLPPIAKIAVLRVTATWVSVAGLTAPVPGRAVRLRTTFAQASTSTDVEHTVHVVAAYGRPAWILTPARYDAYRVGECRA
jgi:hypothetical protein